MLFRSPGDPFGLVIVSHGIITSADLVDAAIISRRKLSPNDPNFKSIDAKVRDFIERLAPAFDDDERLRRRRPFPRLTTDECVGASCTLRQSTLRMEVQ